MNNNKAQALVEFVLILPVFIMFLFAIIDFGNIYISKSSLESKLNEAYEVVKNSKDETKLNSEIEKKVNTNSDRKVNVELTFDDKKEYLNIKLTSNIKTITPGLNLIFGNPYKVSAERVVKYVK